MEGNLFETIYNHPAFSKDDFKEILETHTRIDLLKGQLLLETGKVSNEYFLIEKGLFRSFAYDYKGNEITTDFFIEKEILIEVSSLFQRVPSNENLQALSNGSVWKIEFNDFQKLLTISVSLGNILEKSAIFILFYTLILKKN